MTKIIVAALIALSNLGCATNQTQSSSSAPSIKNSALETNDQNLKMLTASQIRSDLGSIDGQIAILDGMIANAQARIQSYQSMDVPGKEGMIAGAQGELMSYQGQKNSLMARRSKLQAAPLQNQ